MTRQARAELMRIDVALHARTCAEKLDAVMLLSTADQRAALRSTRVTEVTVDGDRALFRVARSSATSDEPGHARRQGGRWLVDGSGRGGDVGRPGG